MKVTNKKTLSMICLIFTAIFLISNAYAWGVAGLYTEQTPLILPPGESEIVTFQLQNMIGDSDIKVIVTILDGSDYVEIIGPTSYTVPIGTHDTEVKFRVTAPPTEGTYPIRISFETTSTQTGGGVSMETGMDRKFNLISTKGALPPTTLPEEQKGATWLPYVLIAVVIIAAVLIIIFARKKKR